jgi:threonyl-tRNA synthetase
MVTSVAVRARGGVDLGVMPIEDFIARLQKDISQKDRNRA